MPDITMCTSKTCKNREQCYRAMAKPDKYQPYGDFTKICAEKDYQCMWTIKEDDIVVNDMDNLLARC